MNKLLAMALAFVLMFGSAYAYLPISVSSNAYDATANFTADALATTVDDYTGVTIDCTTPLTTTFGLTVTNITTMWAGQFVINETGSWNCTALAYNGTDTEFNTSTFIVVCPTSKPVLLSNVCYSYITITVDTNLTYYDIGDNVTLWADLSNSSLLNSVWVYSADNTTYPFVYSSIRDKWYIYYNVKQKQEVLIVQSFAIDGNVTGVGEYILTYNPITVTNSTFESLWKDILYMAAIGGIGLLVILMVIFAGPMVLSLMFQNMKER